jgi:hypothetical protein
MSSHPRRRTQILSGAAIVCLLFLAAGGTAIATNTLGAGDKFDHLLARIDRFLAGPPPDVPSVTVQVDDGDETDPPDATPTPIPTATPSLEPGETPPPTPIPTATPTPVPGRVAVDVNIVSKPKKVFASELKDTWCSTAGVQITLAVLGLADTSDGFQKELQSKVHGWESYRDSHNGDWGPGAMALALDAYGAKGYEVRAYKTRNGALRDAAKQIEATNSPVLLLAWRGAHTWVMTGFRADADPAIFKDATVSGTYILDPWYPRISSIWGASDPPGTFQDTSEMERNYLKWNRPEGNYADRDGLYIAVVPTIPVSE